MNDRLLALVNPDEVTVVIRVAEEAEVDEMGALVGKQREPRWLWPALEPRRGQVLAHGFGRRQDEGF